MSWVTSHLSVQLLISAQVMISWFMDLSPMSCSAPVVQGLLGILFPALPSRVHMLTRYLSQNFRLLGWIQSLARTLSEKCRHEGEKAGGTQGGRKGGSKGGRTSLLAKVGRSREGFTLCLGPRASRCHFLATGFSEPSPHSAGSVALCHQVGCLFAPEWARSAKVNLPTPHRISGDVLPSSKGHGSGFQEESGT